MIIGERFVWLHFPKCAGTEVEGVLRSHFADNSKLLFDSIDNKSSHWHDSITDRQKRDPSFQLEGREVLCCFRRLPYWLLSRIYFEKARSPDLVVTREMFLKGEFFESSKHKGKADQYAKKYTNTPVARWIRTENLVDDFKSVFSQFIDIGNIADTEFVNRNSRRIAYIPDISFYFTTTDLRGLYDSNPVWAEIEKNIYGDILSI
ncbi:MAG: hypothetical protein AB7F41_12075 [Methylocystis sp.]|uniref:hypothetical protein n=1 Tax=Methylocystis sp. TaxID=1911079 RepID=UPI003D14B554